MPQPIIEVINLSKEYIITHRPSYGTFRDSLTELAARPFRRQPKQPPEHFQALKNLAFSVQAGERIGIIGKNGAGKSTLLKILSQITPPTTGEVNLHGRVASLLEVGTGFHPELTGRENIFLNGAILGMKQSEIRKKFEEIVAFAEIEKFLDTPVKRYSSGMYVRLAFAVAAHLEPEILLVDEVLAVGDVQFQKKSLGKMRDITREGRTILFVSHSMAAIQQLCTRVIWINNGKISADGLPQDIIARYVKEGATSQDSKKDISRPEVRKNSRADSIFQWKQISLRNSEGRESSTVFFNEPFSIVLQGDAKEMIADIRLGVSLHAFSGSPIFHTFQYDSGLSTEIAAGKHTYIITIEPNYLSPGFYEVYLEAHGPSVTDMVPAAFSFSIENVGTSQNAVWENYRAGVLKYPCTWTEGGK